MKVIRASSLLNFSSVAQRHGLDPFALLREAGLRPSMLAQPDAPIPFLKVVRLMELAAQASRDELFTLRVARTCKLSVLGPIGLLLREQPRPRDALLMLHRYPSSSRKAMQLGMCESDGMVTIYVRFLVQADPALRHMAEAVLCVHVEMFRQMMPAGWLPHAAHFRHASPQDLGLHAQIFGRRLQFGAPMDAIVVPSADLDRANPHADPDLARYASQLMAAGPVWLGSADEIDIIKRTVALLLPVGQCRVQRVSEQLGIAPAVLRRYLTDAGFSFTQLVDVVRVERAARLVSQGRLPLAEVASMLGFTAASTFSRWYRRRWGAAPSAGRQCAVAIGRDPVSVRALLSPRADGGSEAPGGGLVARDAEACHGVCQ